MCVSNQINPQMTIFVGLEQKKTFFYQSNTYSKIRTGVRSFGSSLRSCAWFVFSLICVLHGLILI